MYGVKMWLPAVCIGIMSVSAAPAAAQQKSTSTQARQFEVVSVDGNHVVVKGARGAQEITVPDDFQLTVDGKAVPVHDLKPGMKGTATITTTTTTTPVYVTEVKNGEVMQKSGNSIIVRGPDGIKMFTEGDVTKRGVKLLRGGQPMAFGDMNTGDRLTATIVTEKAPRVMTERQVTARLSSPPPTAAAAVPAVSAPPSSGATGTAGATKAARKLPKTASQVPLIGLLGAMSLFAGIGLTIVRRRSA